MERIKMRKLLGYGAAALITAPVWVPLTFLTYIGYKATRFAFKYPKTTVASCALTGLLWYASTNPDIQKMGKETVLQMTTQKAAPINLEERIAYAEPQAPPTDIKPQPASTPEVKASEVRILQDPQFHFYYVKMGDTLEHISYAMSGTPAYATILAQDNKITNSRQLLAGALLKVRNELYRTQNPEFHVQVPFLNSVVIPGNQRISTFFQTSPAETQHILELNSHLGLKYADEFPYKTGARIVYYN
jgi:hypothetical protein